MKTSDFYFDLPEELIAQTPLERRDASRLMVLDKETGATEDMHFYDLPKLLRPGDCLVLNDSRVLPARLLGHREPGGGAVEVLLLIDRGNKTWECLVRPGRKCKPGTRLSFGDGLLRGEVLSVEEGGNRLIRFEYEGIFLELLEQLGRMPLPPYIKAELNDPERYQTVYSREVGSAAAPTAGLHFTKELLEQVQAMGVSLAYVTLHVGLGTFRPVKEEDVLDHEMHSEYCMISAQTAETINRTKRAGGTGDLRGHHLLPDHRELGRRGRHAEGERRLDEYFYLPGLPLQGAGCPHHQLPSARVHPGDAGFRSGGTGAYPERLPTGGGAEVPLLLLRRRHVYPLKRRIEEYICVSSHQNGGPGPAGRLYLRPRHGTDPGIYERGHPGGH